MIDAEHSGVSGRVTSKTLVYGIIGDPVRHSLSPLIHGNFARAMGDDIVYAAFPVIPGKLGEAVRGAHALGIAGLNVTIPHKSAVMEFLAGTDPGADMIAAVNTLKYTEKGYIGHNTDYEGIVGCLRANGAELRGGRAVIIGAGGGAKAAAIAAASENARKITILNRTFEHADSLASRVKTYYNVDIQAVSDERDCETEGAVVIQTTSVGFGAMAGRSPVEPRFLEGAAFALDIVYAPWETEFLRQAARAGVPAVNGFEMLIRQAAASYAIWSGRDVPPAAVMDVMERVGRGFRENREEY